MYGKGKDKRKRAGSKIKLSKLKQYFQCEKLERNMTVLCMYSRVQTVYCKVYLMQRWK